MRSLLGLGVALCALTGPAIGDDLYFGFTRLDPEAQSVVADSYVVVRDGLILSAGQGDAPEASYENRHDMSGLYALPGFIDAHGHLVAGPHTVEVEDGAPVVKMDSIDEVTRYNARMALAFGVTTVRNPGGSTEAAAAYDRNIAEGRWTGPDALHAGAVIQPPPFGGSAFAYPASQAEWDAEAARQAEAGMSYFKLYHGLSEDELALGIEAAHAHGLDAIAHLDQVSWTRAAELGIDGLLHSLPTSADLLPEAERDAYTASLGRDSTPLYRWFELADLDGPEITHMLATLVEHDVSVDLTLTVNAMMTETDPAAVFFPPEEAAYLHPQSRDGMLAMLPLSTYGWTPEDFSRARAAMEQVYAFARRVDAAGVTLLLGTDGNGGGPALARELEFHARAGFTNWEILELATSRNADGLGLSEQTGRIAPGLEADLVFLARNPLDDIGHVRSVEWVVTNGQAHSFADLTANPAAQNGED